MYLKFNEGKGMNSVYANKRERKKKKVKLRFVRHDPGIDYFFIIDRLVCFEKLRNLSDEQTN